MYPSNQIMSIYSLHSIVVLPARQSLCKYFGIFCFFFSLPSFLYAQAQLHPYDNSRFLTAHSTLQQPSAHTFESVSLRNAINQMQSAFSVVIWLDRRVDSEQLVTLPVGQRTHFKCIELLCSQTNTEIAWLENILYIAPSSQSPKIESAFWNLAMNRSTDLWRKKGPSIQWKIPNEVKNVFAQCARSLPIKIEGLDRIEHDLWGAAKLPDASLAAQWSCLLSGFDCSIEVKNRQQCLVIEIPPAADVAFNYPPQIKKIKPDRLETWRVKWATAQISTLKNGMVSITAPVAAHRELIVVSTTPKVDPRNQTPAFNDSRYTLQFQGEAEKLISTLMKQIGLTIEPWPLPDNLKSMQIKIEVENVSLDQLLDKLAAQIHYSIKRDGVNITLESSAK